MIVFTVALVAVIFALVLLMERRDKRDREERKSWQLERANLLQRIQAPELAVVEHNQAQMPTPGVTHALSDEEAAEREEMARVIAEMERAENQALEGRQF